MFFLNAAIFASNAAFNNLGHPFYATIVNWGRQSVGTIAFVIVGVAWFVASGVRIGQYLGGSVFAVLTVLLACRVIAQQKLNGDYPGPFARQARLFSLLQHRRWRYSRARKTCAGFAASGRHANASPASVVTATPPTIIANALLQITT